MWNVPHFRRICSHEVVYWWWVYHSSVINSVCSWRLWIRVWVHVCFCVKRFLSVSILPVFVEVFIFFTQLICLALFIISFRDRSSSQFSAECLILCTPFQIRTDSISCTFVTKLLAKLCYEFTDCFMWMQFAVVEFCNVAVHQLFCCKIIFKFGYYLLLYY